LITSLLLIDHANTGRVISRRFWARRARRLFPALVVLILITAVYAATVTKPEFRQSVRNTAFATLLYVQNFWIVRHPEDFIHPLAHTWSLSVEEQFYLVWPLLLAALLWLSRRRNWLLVGLVIALACASAEYTYLTTSAGALTQTRAQQVLIGAALGVALLGRRVSGVVLEIAGAIALAFLVYASFTLGEHKQLLYKGGFLLIAVAAAVLIAAAVSPGRSRLQAVLSWKPIVGIGLISYGLYLFHFPVFGFVDAQHVIVSEPARIVMRFGLTAIIAIASYVWIEQPIRRGALSRARLQILTPLAVGVVVVAVLIGTSGALPRPTFDEQLQATAFARAKNATPNGTLRVLMVGDSLATSFTTLTRPTFTGGGIHGIVQWASTCDVLGGKVALGPTVLKEQHCSFKPAFTSAVRSFEPDTSVLVLGPSAMLDRVVGGKLLHVGTPEFQTFLFDRLDTVRSLLVERGATLLLTTVPCMTPPPTGPFAAFAVPERDPSRRAAVNNSLSRYAQQHGVRIADLGQLLCSHPAYVGADGVKLRPDALGAAWTWLAPRAREAASHAHGP
jgi:peptidoglycan/LPS O-acetylase OafA/YrhL